MEQLITVYYLIGVMYFVIGIIDRLMDSDNKQTK